MEATSIRHIKSGIEYNKYFSPSNDKIISLGKAEVKDTLEMMAKIVKNTVDQTKAISQVLKGKSVLETSNNIWDFLYNHVQYKLDAHGFEQLRTPNRLWADRQSGVDCDCYSITISSILTNLNIPHSFRITEYSNKGYFQHVYVIVPTGKNTYISIDPVIDQFNKEKLFTKKHDRIMIEHQLLSGIEDNTHVLTYGNEYENQELSGLGSTESLVSTPEAAEETFYAATKKHLTTTLLMLKTNPEKYSDVVSPEVYAEQIAYALENWDDKTSRAAVLEELSEMSELGEDNPDNGVSGYDEFDEFSSLEGYNPAMINRARSIRNSHINSFSNRLAYNNSKALLKVRALKARRRKQRRIVPATIRRKNIHKAPELLHLTKGKELTLRISLGGLFKNVWKKIKTTAKKVHKKAVAVHKKVGKKIVEKHKQVFKVIKKAGSLVLKHNPLSWGIRKALIIALKINLFKMGSRLIAGTLSQSQAIAKGYDLTEWRKVKVALARVHKMIGTIGGKPSEVNNALIKGKAGKIMGLNGLNGLGEYVTAAVGTSAASGMIATITAFLKKINFKKLFTKVKGVSSKVKAFAASRKGAAPVPSDSRAPVVTTPTGEKVAIDDSSHITRDEPMESGFNDDKSTSDGSKPKSKKMLYIGLASAAAIAIGALAMKPKGKKKSLNGAQEVSV